MHLLVLSQYYPRKGSYSGVFIHNQNVNLIKLGVKVTTLVPIPWSPRILWFKRKWRRFGKLPRQTNLDGVQIYYIKYPFLIPSRAFYKANATNLYLSAYFFIRKHLTHIKFDMILARPLIPTGYSAVLLAKRLSIPVACEGTGSDVKIYPYYSKMAHSMFRNVLKGANLLIANAKNLAEEINNQLNETVCEVVYRGVNVKAFKTLTNVSNTRQVLHIQETDILILFVGDLKPAKGILDLLSAFDSIQDFFPNLRLYLIGSPSPSLNNFNSVTNPNRIDKKVVFLGPRRHSDLLLWYNACDFLVLPSYSEGMPNVILEAMACMKPVVTTNVGGIPELVEDGVNGLLVEPGDTTGLSNAMLKLITDNAFAKTLGKNALKTIRASYIDTDNIRKLIALIENRLNGRSND